MIKCEDVTILPWTPWTRRVSFRSDHLGLYLLLWNDPEGICGVVSYQYRKRAKNSVIGLRPGLGAHFWSCDLE